MEPQNNADVLTSALAGRFDYERGAHHGCPQWEYYWYRKRQRVLRLLDRNEHLLAAAKTCADLGCDAGTDLFLLREHIGHSARFIGVDGNPVGLRIANLRKRHFGADDVETIYGDLTRSLPFADAALDFAYCSEVVEHLPQPELLIGEIHRCLRPGGLLLLTTPNEPNVFQRSFWMRRKNATAGRSQPGAVALYGHISLKPYRAWRAIAERAGFREIDADRGAIAYAAGPKHEITWGVQMLAEAALDVLPRFISRTLSDQVIALYRRV